MALLQSVEHRSHQELRLCYQCHKCTAGCPSAADMLFGPDRLIRLIQLGEDQRVLGSPDLWLCAGCGTCGARCPNGIDMAPVMDALRAAALSRGIRPGDPGALAFHRLFLGITRRLGRSHEATLLILYKLRSGNLFADMGSGIRLVVKGKVPLLPHRIAGWRQVAGVMEMRMPRSADPAGEAADGSDPWN
ncbi:MAG: 4Fe-4S dicluster domain-containing protein [Anaerolineales bacterium]|nr:4Fe-4S dicluster domain-containing protein [Anaerolineales bacterium]